MGVDTAKDALFARLKVLAPGPGYLHVPLTQSDGMDDELMLQFSAEQVTTKYRRGFRVREYAKVRDRNEAIDLYVYALAALHYLGSAVTDRLPYWVTLASKPAPAPVTAHPEPATVVVPEARAPMRAAKLPRRGWVDRWR